MPSLPENVSCKCGEQEVLKTELQSTVSKKQN